MKLNQIRSQLSLSLIAFSNPNSQGIDEGIDVAGWHDPAFLAAGNAFRPAAAGGRQHRGAAAHGLLDHQPEAIRQGRKDQKVRGLVLGAKTRPWHVRHVLEQAFELGQEFPSQTERTEQPELRILEPGALPGMQEIVSPLLDTLGADGERDELPIWRLRLRRKAWVGNP